MGGKHGKFIRVSGKVLGYTSFTSTYSAGPRALGEMDIYICILYIRAGGRGFLSI